jgi:hypothetical protein
MRILRVGIGLAMVAAGVVMAFSPIAVGDALGQPHDKPTQMINLRASWGGTVLGLGAFVAWLPALRPWQRTIIGLLMWAMVGIGAARLLGFALDGHPDTRQWIWITAEVVIVVACALRLRYLACRSA